MAKSKADKAPELLTDYPVEIIDEKAIVEIKMSTSFFKRLQLLYMSMIKDMSQEERQKFLEETKKRAVSNEEHYHIETLLILLSEFQKNAKSQGQTKTVSQEEFRKMTEDLAAKQQETQK